jgi:excisionase family DNA binding protein
MPKVVDTPEALSAFVADARSRIEAGESAEIAVGDVRHSLEPDVGRALLALLEAVARGTSIDLTVLPSELTTGQVADLLGTSRPTVVKLIDSGELPATRVGTRRRVALTDALAYRDEVRTRRSEGLDEIVALSQELDLY